MEKQKAIIYCRVSSKLQMEEGHGLESQENICVEYANQKKYNVIKVFKEEGITGGAIERPAMTRLLKYLEKRNEKIVVIFDDISRLARNIEGHFQLKASIALRKGIIESPTMKFEDTASGKLVESLLASTAEFQRSQNKENI